MFSYIHKHYINDLFIFLFYAKPTFSPARLRVLSEILFSFLFNRLQGRHYSRCYFYVGLVINFR